MQSRVLARCGEISHYLNEETPFLSRCRGPSWPYVQPMIYQSKSTLSLPMAGRVVCYIPASQLTPQQPPSTNSPSCSTLSDCCNAGLIDTSHCLMFSQVFGKRSRSGWCRISESEQVGPSDQPTSPVRMNTASIHSYSRQLGSSYLATGILSKVTLQEDLLNRWISSQCLCWGVSCHTLGYIKFSLRLHGC